MCYKGINDFNAEIRNFEGNRGQYLRDKFKNNYGIELTAQDIENRIKLKGAVEGSLNKRLKELQSEIEIKTSGLSKNQIKKGAYNRIVNEENAKLGPAVAGILDTKTGEIYIRINSIDNVPPEKLNNLLKERVPLPDWVENYYTHTKNGKGGGHAEVYALNDALNAREGAELSDMMCFVMQTGRDAKKLTKEGLAMARCPHCEFVTNGVKYFPEPLWYNKLGGRKYGDYLIKN